MVMIRNLFILILVATVLTGCINIPIGDGNKLKLSKDGITITDNEGKENNISIGEEGISYSDSEGNEGGITVDSEEGTIDFKGINKDGEETNFTMGQNIDLPEGFPDEIPMADDAEIWMANKQNDDILVMYMSKMSHEDVKKMYKDFFDKNIPGDETESYEHASEGGKASGYVGPFKDKGLSVQIYEVSDQDEEGMEEVNSQITILFGESYH